MGQGATACRRSRRSTTTASSSTASARSTGKNAADPATADAVFEELKKKDRLFATEQLRPPLPALLAVQDGAAVPPGGRVVHQHGAAADEEGFRGDIMKVVEPGDVPARVDQRQGPRAGLAPEHGRLDDLEEALLGPGAADLGGRGRPDDFEVIGCYEELKERAVEGWERVRGPHAAPAVGRQGQDPATRRPGNLMSRIPDVGNPWLDAGIVPFSTMSYNTRPRLLGEVVSRPTSSPRASPASSATGSTRSWR